jgi:transcriptional regulator with XRE-family HTH domain
MTLQINGEVAAQVRGVVAKLGVKHVDIAAALQLTPMSLSRRMRGEVSFSAEEIFALAAFLKVDVSVFSTAATTTTSPAATTGAAAPHVDVALAGETADGQGSAGQSGKARNQLAAASTRAFPAIAETRD